MARLSITLLAAALTLPALAAAEPGYFRSPAIRGDSVVFTAEGDLWTVATSGGLARRLTSHPAEEAQALISPDGTQVAFVAAYDGTPELYRMPLAGGEPERLSFNGGRLLLSNWGADGALLYSNDALSGLSSFRRVIALDPARGLESVLPPADATEALREADGTLWFTRYGLWQTADNARRYRGGAMAQLWRWREGEPEATRIAADWSANLTRPARWRDRLVLTADADGVANLWSLALDGSDPQPLTQHRDFEVRGASVDADRAVYQHGADLRLIDLVTRSDQRIPIQLGSDFEQRRERHLRRPLAFAPGFQLAADGSSVAVAARGRVVLAGTGPKRRIELTVPAGSRVRAAVPAVGGKSVFAIVDSAAGSEVWRFPADGSPGGEALTQGGDAYRWRLYPSPDGHYLAHDDKQGRLWVSDLKSGQTRLVDEAVLERDDAYQRVSWSTDGRLLAVARPDSARLLNQIVLIEVEGERRAVLSSDRYESYDPAFSADGQWLYFLSNRNFQTTPAGGPWGDRNTGPFYDQRTRVYALALSTANRFPFLAPDELGGAAADTGKSAERAVEWSGLSARLYEVPMPPGNYRGLMLDAERLYLLDQPAAAGARASLKTLAISNAAPTSAVHTPEVAAAQLSADGKKLLIVRPGTDPLAPQAPGEVLIVDAGATLPTDVSKAVVRLADWVLPLDPVAEWRQQFDDAWRMHREFSFDPAMRGVDWESVHARYRPLVDRLTDRAELDDLLAQMSAEVGLLHSQVRGGEYRSDPEPAPAAGLGAELIRDADGVRLGRIWRNDPELIHERGPLLAPGVDAREGDRLLAVNGRPVRRIGEVASALRLQAGQQVLLSLQRGTAAAHRTVVVPVAMDREATLRYADWVQGRREQVERASSGRYGYLHLRAMTAGDMAGFVRDFYAQFDREGLVIDVRRNRGGNIDAWVLEKLLKRAWAFWKPPGTAPYTNMQQAFRGRLVVLADALTYSDGETFAAGIKALGLGPVVGERTAGAGIWLADRNRLSDGGSARIAEFGQFDIEGRWLIEGHGVEPDVAVENLPIATGRGGDAQLDAALRLLDEALSREPVRQLRAEPIPPLGRHGRG
ncbi:MAG: S41 family peptidase [Xanthomonadales bacterium]|nr:S41 family peptidase [Xanthomonadales bacterium]